MKESKEKAEHLQNEAMEALIRMFPPEKYGEEMDCQVIQDCLTELVDLTKQLREENERLKDALETMEIGSGLSLENDDLQNRIKELEEGIEESFEIIATGETYKGLSILKSLKDTK